MNMHTELIKNRLTQLNNNIFGIKPTPQIKEFLNDQLTPIAAYAAISGAGNCIIESAYDEGYGHYSFIGLNPIATLIAIDKDTTIIDNNSCQEVIYKNIDPYLILDCFRKNRRTFGTVSYDTIRLKENIPNQHQKTILPDFMFRIYKTIIKFDHKSNLISFSHEGNLAELNEIINTIFKPQQLPPLNNNIKQLPELEITSDINDNEFIQKVEQAQEYIKNGDIFQVVLSRTFKAKTTAKPFTIYRALRQISPTAYLAFFEEEDYAIASSSPELLVGVKNNIVETVPIAGTCKKGEDPKLLLENPKETAEHIMLVDLARNDIGAISKPGTVKVNEFKTIRNYSHVSHIVSRVTGELNQNLNSLDALKSALPAGTLSGAPKVRAMEIIDQLETSSRGLYGGAIVTIDENGNLLSSIAIRTAVIYKEYTEIRTGAGVVLDSIPKMEAEETKLKSKGVITALKLAELNTNN